MVKGCEATHTVSGCGRPVAMLQLVAAAELRVTTRWLISSRSERGAIIPK